MLHAGAHNEKEHNCVQLGAHKSICVHLGAYRSICVHAGAHNIKKRSIGLNIGDQWRI